MAKFATNESKSFSPIDSKLLGTLAEPPTAEIAPVEPPPVLAPQVQLPPATTRKDRPAARQAKPEPKLESRTPAIKAKRPQAEPEKLSRVVKCLFTPSEEQELRNLMNRLREKSGITLSFSHLMRPFFELLLLCEEELGDALASAGLRRPINDKNALAAFERQLATALHTALRNTKPPVTDERA